MWSLLVKRVPEAFKAAETLRSLHDVEFGRIQIVIAAGKVRRIIPSYELRESDSEESKEA